MARQTVNLTNAFQQVASGRCTISITLSGKYSFNETASDDAALFDYFQEGEQVVQTEVVATYAKAFDVGIVIVDSEA